MIVVPSMYVVLDSLVRLELSLDLASSFWLKNGSIKRYLWLTYVAFLAVEYKAIFCVTFISCRRFPSCSSCVLLKIHMSSCMDMMPANPSVMLSILIWKMSCDILRLKGILTNLYLPLWVLKVVRYDEGVYK